MEHDLNELLTHLDAIEQGTVTLGRTPHAAAMSWVLMQMPNEQRARLAQAARRTLTSGR